MKSMTRLVGLLGSLVLASQTVAVCEASVLEDGSFELGTPAHVGTLDNWTVSAPPATGPFGYLADGTISAAQGLRLAVFNGGGRLTGSAISKTFPTTPAQQYILNFSMGVFGADGLNGQLQVTLEGNTTLASQAFNATGNGSLSVTPWQGKVLVFTADSATTTLTFTDISTSGEAAAGDLLLDYARVNPAAANTAPVATNDAYSVNVNTQLGVSAPGVLVNDTDAQSDPLTAALDVGPSHGILTLNSDGSFTYMPTTNYTGPDSFTYHASDGIVSSNIATVSITVNAPVAQLLVNGSFELGTPDGNGIVNDVTGWTEGGSGGRVGYVASAPYTATDLSRVMVFNPGVSSTGGSISQSFTTTPGQAYLLEFDMGVLGSLGNEQKFTVSVAGNSTLLSVTDSAFGSGSGVSTWTLGKSHYFVADSTSTTLSFTDVSTQIASVDLLLDHVRVSSSSARVLTVDSAPVTGASVTVSPEDGSGKSDGVAKFTRGYSNGAVVTLTAPATSGSNPFLKWTRNGADFAATAGTSVTMDANYLLTAVYAAGNAAPVAVNDSYAAVENVPLVVAAAGVLSNDTDADLDPLTAILVSGPSHGVFNLNSNGGFSYTPTSGYVGPDSFTYKANDGDSDSNVATVSINVMAATANLVANGSFETGSPAHVGTLDDWTVSAPPATGPFGYLADATIEATDADRLAVFNGGGRAFGASISQTFSTVPGQVYRLSYDVGIAGTALQQQRLRAEVNGETHDEDVTAAGPSSVWVAKTYTFTATLATTTLTFTDMSGSLESGLATGCDLLLDDVRLAIEPGNAYPVAVNDSYSTDKNITLNVVAPGVLANDTDFESDPLTAILVAAPSHGSVTLETDGSFSYIPTTGYVGSDSFTYKVNDTHSDSNVATVSITVTAPIINLVANGSFEQGSPANFGSLDSWNVVESEASAAVGYVDDGTYTAVDPVRLALFNRGGRMFGSTISQTLVTIPGQAYQLDFYVGVVGVAGRKQSLQMTVNGTALLLSPAPDILTAGPGAAIWHPRSYTFVADSAATVLTFLDNSGSPAVGDASSSDLLLDHVRVIEINNARTLTVTSSPVSAQAVTVSPADLAGNSSGTTSFSRTYSNGANVTLTATAAVGANVFQKWQKNGSDVTTNLTTNVLMEANHTMNAVYIVDNSPRAYADSYSTVEETELTVAAPGVLSNDEEPDSLPITAVLDSTTSNGTLDFETDGGFSYVPNLNFSGPDTFTYHATNGTLDSAVVTVTINATPVNDAPSAQPLSVETDEDVAVLTTLAGTDPDNDPLAFVVVDAPENGVLSGTNQNLTYTPNPHTHGIDTFTFTVNDGSGPSAPATVSINVIPVPDPPVAIAQSLSMTGGTSIPVILAGTDPDDDELELVVLTQPAHGVLSGTLPNLVYTPVANYVGSDSFTFKANDGTTDSATATISITITNVIRNGSFENGTGVPDFWTVSGNYEWATSDTVPPLKRTATDGSKLIAFNAGGLVPNAVFSQTFATTPGRPYILTFDRGVQAFNTFEQRLGVSVVGNTTLISQTESVYGANNNGFTVWMPRTYPYFVANSATTTLTFRDLSPATGGLDLLLDNVKVTPQVSHALTVNSSPDAGVSVTVGTADVSGNTNGVTGFNRIYFGGASVSLSVPAAIGATNFEKWQKNGVDFSVTPAINVTMDAAHTMTAFYIPNLPPVALADSYTTNEDTQLVVPVLTGILANDSDPELKPITAVLETTTSHGLLVLNANGSFSYTPNLNYVGQDSFTYHASDSVVNSTVTTVSLTVTAVNDAPVAVADAGTTAEDTLLTVAAPGVLSNDTDIEGGTLTVAVVTGPAHGTLTLNANGGYDYDPADNY
ncbi:MAG: Ig-like domain-containing protein, partial [Verrucomicrobiota bacterium]